MVPLRLRPARIGQRRRCLHGANADARARSERRRPAHRDPRHAALGALPRAAPRGGHAVKMLQKPLSRRTLLAGAAGASIALPWLEAFAPSRAFAQNALPRRFVVMFTPN